MNFNIAFEGGGGKGAAYLLVAKYLEQKEVWDKLNGFSGSSAGALTALAMAIGIPAKVLEKFSQKGGFSQVLSQGAEANKDTGPYLHGIIQEQQGIVQSGKIELPYEYIQAYNIRRSNFKSAEALINLSDDVLAGTLISSPFIPLKFAGAALGKIRPMAKFKDWALGKTGLLKDYINANTYATLLTTGGLFRGQKIVDTIYNSIYEYGKETNQLKNIHSNLGRLYKKENKLMKFIISSNNIQLNNSQIDFNNNILPSSLYGKAATQPSDSFKSPAYSSKSNYSAVVRFLDIFEDGLTFENLYQLTKKDLIITGSNLLDGKVYYFSKTTTPTFPVAEAVAISMHIPIVWAPVFVYYKYNGIDYTGFYVDGGLYNNFPIRIFNAPKTGQDKNELMKVPLKNEDNKSIGFCIDPKADYLNFDFPAPLSLISAAGFSVLDKSTFDNFYTDEVKEHICILQSGSTKTMDFSPTQSMLDELYNLNNNKVFNFLKQHFPSIKNPK